jgi:hypothetical protein
MLQSPLLTDNIHPFSVYGTAPDFNLAQWTGVLHLADKWGFDYLRNVAVKAILPLSSCVDKIVIGQKYGLEDGLAGAFADLLARDADLSLEEGTALGLPAVIAIAGGRARARQNGSILSRQTIERLVEEIFMPRRSILETSSVLFNVDPARIVEKQANALQPDSLSVPDATTGDSISASHQRSLDRWANFAVLHGTAGRELLIKHLNDHKSHGKYAVNAVLSSFWEAYERHWKAEIASYHPLIYPEHTLKALRMLKLNMLAPEFNEAIKSFCLGAINQWISLSEIILCSPTFSKMSNYYQPGSRENFYIQNFWQDFCSAVPDQLFNLATTIRCTRYIIDSDVIENHTLSKVLFAGLWIKLKNTFDQLWTLDKQSAGTKLQSLMALFGHSAFTNVACKEMDDFYLQAHDAVQTEPQTESSSVKGLQVCTCFCMIVSTRELICSFTEIN